MRLLTLEGKCNICGERVRTAWEGQKLSQEELAARIQLNGHLLTQKAIRGIERFLSVTKSGWNPWQPVGGSSISRQSYNKGSNWLTFTSLGYEVRHERLVSTPTRKCHFSPE